MPYFRRLAKFGFTNAAFRTHFWIVNLREIVAHPAFAKGGTVNLKSLQDAGLVRDDSRDLKILGAPRPVKRPPPPPIAALRGLAREALSTLLRSVLRAGGRLARRARGA